MTASPPARAPGLQRCGWWAFTTVSSPRTRRPCGDFATCISGALRSLAPAPAGTPPMSGLPEALETAREAGEVLSAAVLSQENAEGWTAPAWTSGTAGSSPAACGTAISPAQPFTAAPSPDVSWRTAASPPPIGRTAASPAANGTARTCAAPGGRTAFWRRLCFVMSTFPAASGSVFP